MIRTFTLQVDDETFDTGDRVDLVVEINDAEVGMTMTVDGKTYRLRDKAVSELQQVISQVEFEQDPFSH